MNPRVLCSLLLAAPLWATAQVVVIVNSKAGAEALNAEQISAFFLGKASSLPGGLSQALDLPESAAAREHFYSKATGKSPSQVKAIWARLAFSGKATPPRELTTAEDVKKFVAAHPEAIGYIEKSALDGSVKVMLTVE